MTLAVQAGRNDYIGNASTTAFFYTFRIINTGDIGVFLDGSQQTLTTHFTLSGVGNANGGTVTFLTAPGTDVAVLLLRTQPLKQGSDYIPNESFPAERIESDLDKLSMQVQMLQEELGRCIKLEKKSLHSDKDVDDLVAGKFLLVKAAAAGIQMGDLAAAGAITIPVTVAEGGTGATTPAAARDTLLADEDARTNTVKVIATKKATTTGTPAAGIGIGDKWQAESADEDPADFGQIEFAASDVGAGTEDTFMQVLLRVAGAALVSCYRWAATGAFNGIFTHANTAARTYTLPDKDGTFAMTNDVTVLRGHLGGLGITNNGTDIDHDLEIAIGQAVDDTVTTLMVLASVLVKQIDNGFVVGTNQGGLDTGAVAASETYHIFLIRRSDTGVVDVLFSLSPTAPTLPTNYDEQRRIGSRTTDASSNWIPTDQNGDVVLLDVPDQGFNANDPGTAAVLRALAVPTDIKVFPLLTLLLEDTSFGGVAWFALVTDADQADTVASVSASQGQIAGPTADDIRASVYLTHIATNTSAQVRTRISVSDAGITITGILHGWIDRRGRDA